MKTNLMKILGGIVVLLGGLPATLQALNNSWTNSGSGLWQDGGNWSAAGGAPTATDAVYITNALSKTVTINAVTPAVNLTISNLSIYSVGSATNTLYFSSNSTSLTISGTLALGGGGVGALVVDGGQLVTVNAALKSYVGQLSAGSMTVSNGGWTASGEVRVGWNAPGTLTLAGGTNNFSAGLILSQSAAITGTVLMTGGKLTTSATTLGNVSAGIGVMTVSGGTWVDNGTAVGSSGGSVGALNLAGGTNLLSSLIIGSAAGATGTVSMTGGQLVTTNSGGTEIVYVGNGGAGAMTVSGGQWLAKGVVLGNAAGSVGSLTLAGGTNTISGPLKIGRALGAVGRMLISDVGFLEFSGSGVISNGVYHATTPAIGTITNQNGGVIQFNVNPTIVLGNGVLNSNSCFVVTNATIAFKGLANADVGAVTNKTSGVTVQADSRLRLDGSTNAAGLASFTVGGAGNYAQLELTGTNSLWRSTNLTVNGKGALSGSNGTFVLYGDFVNQSTNRAQFDLSRSTVLFTNGVAGAIDHTLDLTGSGAADMGSNGFMNAVQLATNFSIGTLSIAQSNRLTLTGDHLTNALYVGYLDLSAWTTNATDLSITLSNALTLSSINLYYDMSDTRNAYLQNSEYNLWGGQGLLIPIPEPSTAGLILGGALFSAWLLRRKSWCR